METMEQVTDFAVKKAVELLAIDSPTGFTAAAADWVRREFEALGFPDRKSTRLNSSHRL